MSKFGSALTILILAACGITAQEPAGLFTQDFPPEEFATRRSHVYDAIGKQGVAVLQGAVMPHGYVRFRQTNSFYYLSGIESPYATLLLDGARRKATIFLQPRNARRESVEGKMLAAEDVELVTELTGLENVKPVSELAGVLQTYSQHKQEIAFYTPFSPAIGTANARDMERRRNAEIKKNAWDGRVSRETHFQNLLQKALPEITIKNFSPIVDSLRLYKSEREIELIRKATRLSCLALLESMRSTAPGIYEREIDAVAKYIFFGNGAQGHAYYSLVATGKNAWFPHYHAGRKRMESGELVLVDVAPDFKYYVTDVTRQWPVNGKFSPAQREIYGFYLACYRAILAEIKPHHRGPAIKKRAHQRMQKILATATFSKEIYSQAASRFVERYGKSINGYGGKLGHWVGMSAHDVGDFKGTYKPGMVFTIEPALRVPEEQLYIRLEDMILITEEGIDILSDFLPLDIEEIEKIIAEPGILQMRSPGSIAAPTTRWIIPK